MIFGFGFIKPSRQPVVFDTLIETIKNWQTLIGAVLALIAACFTVFVIHRQTTEARKTALELAREHQKGIERKALISLPTALAHISECLEAQWQEMAQMHKEIIKGEALVLKEGRIKSPSADAIITLAEICEHPSDDNIADYCLGISRRFQYHNSRINSYINENKENKINEIHIFSLSRTIVEIKCLLSKLYDYNDKNFSAEMDKKELLSALRSISSDSNTYCFRERISQEIETNINGVYRYSLSEG
jgi:hypothetical protein